MEAHVSNETRYLLNGGTSAGPSRLVHLIVSAECLEACGIDPSTFTRRDRKERSSELGRSENVVVPKVTVQTRRHADGSCSEWRSCVASFVPSGAIASVLVPRVEAHPQAFVATKIDGGGLFLSATIECDDKGRVDPFDALAVRVSIPDESNDYPRHADVVFYYDELTSLGTRYGADADRLPLLCAQFVLYAGRRQKSLGPWSSEIRSKMISLIRKMAKSGNNASGGPVCFSPNPLDVTRTLNSTVGFDPPGTLDGGDGATDSAPSSSSDGEIRSLLQKAAESIGRAAPAGVSSSSSARRYGDRRRGGAGGGGVVSGLKQGAMATFEDPSYSSSSSSTDPSGRGRSGRGGRGVADAAVYVNGLEPMGCGRFVGGTADAKAVVDRVKYPPSAADAFEDVLIFGGPSDRGPESMIDLLDAAFILMSGGDTPSDLWRRRAVSVVARAHMSSGARFYVVAYERSSALGGRSPRPRGSNRVDSPANALAVACADAKVKSPARLPARDKERIAAEYPALRPLLFPNRIAARRLTTPFSVASEVEFEVLFASACCRAVASAVSAAVRAEPNLPQIFSYVTLERDEVYMDVVAARVPNLLAACVGAIGAERGAKFRSGALSSAVLAHLARSRRRHEYSSQSPSRRGACDDRSAYEWYGTGHDGGEPAGGYSDFVPPRVSRREEEPPTERYFVFDYYSSAGECFRVSKRPIPVLVDSETVSRKADRKHRGCEPCRFPDWFVRLRNESVCERYLPGESYAYVCVGYSVDLTVLVVLPGGFALRADAAEYLAWDRDEASGALDRAFVKSVP